MNNSNQTKRRLIRRIEDIQIPNLKFTYHSQWTFNDGITFKDNYIVMRVKTVDEDIPIGLLEYRFINGELLITAIQGIKDFNTKRNLHLEYRDWATTITREFLRSAIREGILNISLSTTQIDIALKRINMHKEEIEEYKTKIKRIIDFNTLDEYNQKLIRIYTAKIKQLSQEIEILKQRIVFYYKIRDRFFVKGESKIKWSINKEKALYKESTITPEKRKKVINLIRSKVR